MTNPFRNARANDYAPDPTRKAAFATGLFYILTFASSIPAVFLLAPILSDPNYVLGPGDPSLGWAFVLDMVNAFTAIGTAVAVYSILKRRHESLALGFVATRIMEAAIISIGVVSLLALVSLRAQGVPAEDAGAAVIVDRTLVAGRDWTFLLGPNLMAALNASMFATALFRSRLVPRAIPALGMIGAPLMVAFVIATLAGFVELGSPLVQIVGAPFFFWELSVGIWMVVKGFNRNSPIVAEAIASATEASNAPDYISATAAVAKAGAA